MVFHCSRFPGCSRHSPFAEALAPCVHASVACARRQSSPRLFQPSALIPSRSIRLTRHWTQTAPDRMTHADTASHGSTALMHGNRTCRYCARNRRVRLSERGLGMVAVLPNRSGPSPWSIADEMRVEHRGLPSLSDGRLGEVGIQANRRRGQLRRAGRQGLQLLTFPRVRNDHRAERTAASLRISNRLTRCSSEILAGGA